MRHEITLTGPAFRIRPVCDSDAEFILSLRTDSALTQYLHATSSDLSQQLEWLSRYYDRNGDYYFVVEGLDTSKSEGLVSIYDINETSECGEWGRWILRHNSLAAIESSMLIYRCAFEILNLKSLCSYTVRDNQSVVSFHDSCGIRDSTVISGYFTFDGKKRDAVRHIINRTDWPEISKQLEHLSTMVSRKIRYV